MDYIDLDVHESLPRGGEIFLLLRRIHKFIEIYFPRKSDPGRSRTSRELHCSKHVIPSGELTEAGVLASKFFCH